MTPPRPRVVVVGAGLSGLTVASELAARSFPVTVVERGDAVGGLARTFRYGEGFFDVGPHRLHAEDPGLVRWVEEALGGEARRIRRRSAVHAFGRYHPWPLRRRVLGDLPLTVLARAARDLVRPATPGGESFEAEMRSRYGETLYASFFEGYTRRFLDEDPARLHRDWGRAGVDRAVIDRRVRAAGLWDLLRGLLRPAPVDTTFLYPEDGIARLAEALRDRLAGAGGRLVLGRAVDAMSHDGRRVTAVAAGGERFPLDALVWTGPLPAAARLAGADATGLRFRSTVLVNLTLRAPPRHDHQWIYFGDEPAFVRVSAPAAFSPSATAPGSWALCVESTCAEGDATWAAADAAVGAVVGALARCGMIGGPAEVVAARVERVADTYPIYGLDYRRRRDDCLARLAALENLLLAGRCGRFWYNNMDHSIAQALRIAAQLADGASPAEVDVGALEFWEDQRGRPTSSVDAGR